MTDVVVDCDNGSGSAVVNPSSGPGVLVEGSGYTQSDPGPLVGAAVYRGEESLPGIDKKFWNVAMGFDTTSGLENCTISANATASDGYLAGGVTPADTAYPHGGVPRNCGNWTNTVVNSGNHSYAWGLANHVDGRWSNATNQACSNPSRIYCFELPPTP